ncbi:hypothetical protein LIER_05211 [Lithospermum erythrorhizon]|uniref:Uncharacterized protein n=1 Tax=Lithospermum erythrorhizon TaxID=34254 RepID=A0AAV3NZZ6_LITER
MGGKGIRRREKNYKAAHGGTDRLPPPPDASSLDTLPFKLRKLFSLTSDGKASLEGADKNGGTKNTLSNRTQPHDLKDAKSKAWGDGNDRALGVQHNKHGDKTPEVMTNETKKKKRKRNKADDLRFETLDGVGAIGSKRKERKKQRTAERKKKHKKSKTEEETDFPGHEHVKFGDVVQAPPKLLSLPKPSKNSHDPSQERLRLQAVEDYRKRKGWTSRPGFQLSPPVAALM